MSTLNECGSSPAHQGGASIGAARSHHQHHLNPNSMAKNLARGNSVVTLNQIYQHQNSIPARNRILSTTKSLQQQSIDLPGEPKLASSSSAHSHEAIQQQQKTRLQTQSVQSSSSSPKTTIGKSTVRSQLTSQQQAKIRASSPISINHHQPEAVMKLSSISPPVRIIQVVRRHHQHHHPRRSSDGTNRRNVTSRHHTEPHAPTSNYRNPLNATGEPPRAAWSDSSETTSASSSTSPAPSPRVSPYNERRLNAPAEISQQQRPISPAGAAQPTASSNQLATNSTSPNRRRLLPVSPQHPNVPATASSSSQQQLMTGVGPTSSLPHLRQYARQSTIAGGPGTMVAGVNSNHSMGATLNRQSSAMSMHTNTKLYSTDIPLASDSLNVVKRHRKLPQIPPMSGALSGQSVQSTVRPATSSWQHQQLLSSSSSVSPASASAFSSTSQVAAQAAGNFQRPASSRVTQPLTQRQQQQLRVQSAPMATMTGANLQFAGAQQAQPPPAVMSQPIVTRPSQPGWRQLEKHHSGGSSGANSTDTPSPRSPIQTAVAQRTGSRQFHQQQQQQQENSNLRSAKYSASSASSASTSTSKSPHVVRAESMVPEVDVSSYFTFDGHALSSGNLTNEGALSGTDQPLAAPLRSPGAAISSPRQESAPVGGAGGGGGTLELATTPRGRRLSSCGLGLRANFLMNKQHAISEFTPPRSLESSHSRSSTDAERNWPPSQQHHVSPTLLAAHCPSNTNDAPSSLYTQPDQQSQAASGRLFPTVGPNLPPVLLNRRPSGHGLPQRAASASETTTGTAAAPVNSAYANNLTGQFLYGGANMGDLMNIKLNPATRSMIAVPAATSGLSAAPGSEQTHAGWPWPSGVRADCAPLASSLMVDASARNAHLLPGGLNRLGAHPMHNALSIDVYQCNSLEEAPLSPPLVPPAPVSGGSVAPGGEPANFLNVQSAVVGSGSNRASSLTPHFSQQQQQRGSSLAIPDSHLVPPTQQRDRQHSNVSTNSMPAGSSFGQFLSDPNNTNSRNLSGGNLSVGCNITGGSNSASGSINFAANSSNNQQYSQNTAVANSNNLEGRAQRKFGLWAERIAAANSRTARDDEDEDDDDNNASGRTRSACQPDRLASAGNNAARSNSSVGSQAAPSAKSRQRSRFERQRQKQLHKQRQQQQQHPEWHRHRRRSELRNVDEQQRRHSGRPDSSSCELSSSSSESLSADELRRGDSVNESPIDNSNTRLLPAAQAKPRRPSVARFSVIPSSHRQQQQQQALLVRTANAFGAQIGVDQLTLADRLKLAEKSANKLFRKVELSPQRSRADEDNNNNNNKQPIVERAKSRAVESVRKSEPAHDDDQQSDDLSQFLRSVERRLTAELATQERKSAATTRQDSNSAGGDKTVASFESGDSSMSGGKKAAAAAASAGVSLDRSASAASRAVRRAMTLRSLVRTFSRRTSSCDTPASSQKHQQQQHQHQLASDTQKYPNLLSVASDVRQRRSAECLSVAGGGAETSGQLSPAVAPFESPTTDTRSPQRGQSVRRRAARLFRRTKTQQQQQQQHHQQQATNEDRRGNMFASSVSGSSKTAAIRGQDPVSTNGGTTVCASRIDQNHFADNKDARADDTKLAPLEVNKASRATLDDGDEQLGADKQLARMKSVITAVSKRLEPLRHMRSLTSRANSTGASQQPATGDGDI